MTKYIVNGGKPLRGAVKILGDADAAFNEVVLGLYSEDPIVLHGVPKTEKILNLLLATKELGMESSFVEDTLSVRTKNLVGNSVNTGFDSRTGSLFIGPLLHLAGEVFLSKKFVKRTVVECLKSFSVDCELRDDIYFISAKQKNSGGRYAFVNSTENDILTVLYVAVGLRGTFILEDVVETSALSDAILLLTKMGAEIERLESGVLKVDGVASFHGVEHEVLPDIEDAKLFANAAVVTSGDVVLSGVDWTSFSSFLIQLEDVGGQYEIQPDGVRIFGHVISELSENPVVFALSSQTETILHDGDIRDIDIERLKQLGADITVVKE